MRRWVPPTIIFSMAVTMSFTEFAALQQLPAEALRSRFALPASCDPSVTALTTNTSGNEVSVFIDCRPTVKSPDSTPASGGPAGRPARKP